MTAIDSDIFGDETIAKYSLADYDVAIARAKAMATPDALMAWLEPTWTRPKHVRYMGAKLAEVLEGNKRIMLSCSVRHGKSWAASHALPVWYLAHRPANLIGMATYQANFSALWGRRVRNTITEHSAKLGIEVAADSGAAHSWETTEKGGMHTAGVGGEFTGRGFSLMICDDPIKNWAEANSELMRESMIEWWRTTFRTRLEPGGSIILTMARWHEDDLAGKLLDEMTDGGDQWEVVDLPALARKGDVLNRKPGEALWPERYSVGDLDATKQAVGKRAWQSLYQQEPRAEDGNRYKREWFRYAKRIDSGYQLPQDDGTTMTVYDADLLTIAVADLAQTAKTQADYTVRGIIAVTKKGDIILLDIWRAQADSPTVKRVLRSDFARFGLDRGAYEDAHWGKTLNQEFLAEGLPVTPLKPGTQDKVARSSIVEPMFEGGKFFFVEGIPNLDDLEAELLSFPQGKHDDCADMVAWCGIVVSKLTRPGIMFTEFHDEPYRDGGQIIPNMAEMPRDCYAWLMLQPGATTGALLGTMDIEGTMVVLDEMYEANADAESLQGRLTGLLARNKVSRRDDMRGMMMDPDSVYMRQKEVGVTASELSSRGWNFGPWIETSQEMADSQVQILLRSRKLVICERCKNLRRELSQYARKMDRDGLPVDGAYLGSDYLIRPLRAFVGSSPSYGARVQ